ncbi:MAG: recombinase family protein [Pseudanabaena sp. M38BS1SP1A06MG]|nr:recombinase family protein [Pseudanabaena sp. M34BS1SP1A06MG]MCA6591492.1 recombinase family protein [Pseudanabaena sp. M38BS1SP1A06MG]
MKIIGYARVSSKEQSEGRSIENQIKVLMAAGCDDVLVDIESAYSKRDRPNFNKLMEMVRSGVISKVIVCTLDRLSRNETVTFIAFDDFEKAGCQLISLEENFNLQSPEGRLQAGFAALMARNYSAQLSQKTRRGHKARRDRNASYFKCFGYKIIDERYVLDHDPFLCLLQDKSTLSKAAIASDMITTFKDCQSLRRTLHTINIKYGLVTFSIQGKGNRQARNRFAFSASGLHSWLSNPILRGHTAYKRSQKQQQHHKHLWDIRYNTHPDDRLITDLEYREIDRIFDWNKQHHGFDNQTKNIHPLSGLVYCGECGRSHRVMGSLQRDKVTKLYYYQCQNYGVRACSQKKSIRDIRVEESAIAKLTSAAEQIANIADSPLELQEPVELRELRSQLATLEAMGSNPAIVQAIGETKAQIAALEYQTISGVNVNSGLREILFETFNNPLYFSTLPIEQKKAIYRALIDRIVVKDGEVVGVELKI